MGDAALLPELNDLQVLNQLFLFAFAFGFGFHLALLATVALDVQAPTALGEYLLHKVFAGNAYTNLSAFP